MLAIKALETPFLWPGALAAGDFKKLQALALRYASKPIDEITCVIYDESEADEAYDRVMNRHTGAQDGEGMVEWGSDEKNRFSSRHGRGPPAHIGRSGAGLPRGRRRADQFEGPDLHHPRASAR